MSRNTRKCVICEKSEYGTYKAKLFYSAFPLEENRCREWVRLVGNPDLVFLPIEKLHTQRFVCGDHFTKKQFNKKGNRLKKSAVPTLKLKSVPLTGDQMKEFPQHMWNFEKGNSSKENIGHCSKDVPDVPPAKKLKTATSSVLAELNKEFESSISAADFGHSKQEKIIETACSRVEPDVSRTKTLKSKLSSGPSSNIKGETATEETDMEKSKKQEIVLTPRKKKLIQQLQKTKRTLKSLTKSAKLIEQIESPVLRNFILGAAKNQNRKKQGRRWTTQNKISCLAILKRSARTYKYLRHLIPLPSVKTLQNVLKRLPMHTGVNKSVIDYLKMNGENKNQKEKVCALLFDEMALKPRLLYNATADEVEGFEDLGATKDGYGRRNEIADHALVVMIQGLYKKFKQPIALYFVKNTISSDKLVVIIKEIISAIHATGYRVLVTVCDQGPTNMGAIKLLKEFSGPEGSENSFKVDDNQIFVIYDVPHLFKSIRNNFLKNGNISFAGKVGKWEHLKQVEEKNRNLLFLSKITPTHVNPKYKAKMKVSYAAQALSTTMSAVVKLLAEKEEALGNMEKHQELMSTGEVVRELDKLFDLTNGPSGPDDIKVNIRQNVSNETNHLEEWAELEKKVEQMYFFKNNGTIARNVKCIHGYSITLKSLRHIWCELRALGFQHFNLRQVNQDALENLFGLIRQHSPTNKNPTCAHFLSALKTAIVSNLTAPHSRGANCKKDPNTLLTTFHNLIFDEEKDTENKSMSAQKPQNFNSEEEVFSSGDVPVFHLDEDIEEALVQDTAIDDAVVYVSGYLAYRIQKKTNCDSCISWLINRNPETEDKLYSYIKLREWWADKKSLTYPSRMLCQLVETATSVMEKEICPILFSKNIGELTVTLFMASCDTDWFKCTEHKATIFQSMFLTLSQMLIRRQCQRININLASKEENLADAEKKAQQYGGAK